MSAGRIEPRTLTGDSRDVAAAAQARALYGWVPNTVRVMSHGTTAAEDYLDLALRHRSSSLTGLERELIAVTVAAFNACTYCHTAHGAAARLRGASDEDVVMAGRGRATEQRTAAVLRLVTRILQTRGSIADEDWDDALESGIDPRGAIDITTIVAENILGNYLNNLAQTPIDRELRQGRSGASPPP